MRDYDELYFSKNNKKFVQKREHLEHFLMFRIYSVPVLLSAHQAWSQIPWYLKQNTPLEIQKMIENPGDQFLLQKKLNAYHTQRAIQVLSAYQTCDVPLTQDKRVPTKRYKLTSAAGDMALIKLKQAQQDQLFIDEIADLAIRTGHKFLAEDQYYIPFHIDQLRADSLITPIHLHQEKTIRRAELYPRIQLTEGCLNHCSHCDVCAKPIVSHMPWPMFRGLYKALDKHYQNYPYEEAEQPFGMFFWDSDMLDYEDPIMQVDAGDAGLWVQSQKRPFQYITRGIKNDLNRLALAKALFTPYVSISFVETSMENMPHNIKQLTQTLEVVKSVKKRIINPIILHWHTKKGSQVSPEIFEGFEVLKGMIHAIGRAKQLPPGEAIPPLSSVSAPKLIKPNGDIVMSKFKDGYIHSIVIHNIFKREKNIAKHPLLWTIYDKILSPHAKSIDIFLNKILSR